MCLALATREQALEWVAAQTGGLVPPPVGDPAREPWQRRLVEATALLARDAMVGMASQMPTAPSDFSHPDIHISLVFTYPSPLVPGSKTSGNEGKRLVISIRIPPESYPYRGASSGAAAHISVSAPPKTLGFPDRLLDAINDGAVPDALLAQALGVFSIPLDEDIAIGVLRYLEPESAWATEFVKRGMETALPAPARDAPLRVGRM